MVCTTDFLIGRLSDFRLINMHLILSLGGVLTFSWFLLRWNRKVVHYMLEMSQEHKIALSAGKLDMLSKLATIFIIFVTIFLIMDVTERDIQAIIAFGGIGGLALAFASQQVISNFFGGVMVYFTKPFTIGELVNLPDKKIEGHIEEIGWYMTCIRSLDKKPIYVPNSIFTQTIMVNPSRMSHNRFFYSFGLRHSSLPFINEVVNSIKVMLLKHPDVDHHLKLEVYFAGFEPTSLTLTISAYIKLGGEDFNMIKQNILLKVGEIIELSGAEFATIRYPAEMQEITPRKQLTSELVPALSS
jgi:MscS family membrane protein